MTKTTMNVKELIRAASAESEGKKTQKEITEIINLLDVVVRKQVATASADAKVEVKILPCGVSVVSEYVEPHEARNPMTGETVRVPGKNRVKAKLGSVIKDAANA